MSFSDNQVDLLAKVAGMMSKRHDVIAANIANVNTPNYRAKEMDFEEEFHRLLNRGDRQGALDVEAEIREDDTTPLRADGNNVLVEKEMGQMYRNSLVGSVFGQLLKSRLELIRMAINGR